jgi:hypothetical protein
MVQGEAVRRRNLHGAAHCNGGALPVLNGSGGHGNGASVSAGDEGTMPWLVRACAGLTGRI